MSDTENSLPLFVQLTDPSIYAEVDAVLGLTEAGYSFEDVKDAWFELSETDEISNPGYSRAFLYMQDILDQNPNAQFLYLWGTPSRLSLESSENYIEEVGRTTEDYFGEVESAAEDVTVLTAYQKDLIKEIVLADFECGHFTTAEFFIEDEEGDFTGVEQEAADCYQELVDMGPAGFYEEFADELDFDPDFVAEYGDPDDEDDDYEETSSTLDDNDWDEEDDPLYGYGEDDGLEESTKRKVQEGEEQFVYYDDPEVWGDIYRDLLEEAVMSFDGDPSDINSEKLWTDIDALVRDYKGTESGLESYVKSHINISDYFPKDDPDEVKDMGEMYGAPRGASSEEALKFFEDEKEDKDCEKKSKKDKLNEISEEGLAKVVVAYKAGDPKKEPLKDSQGETYSVAYNEGLSDKQNIDKLKRLLRQKGISEPAILKLRFKKMTA